MQDIREDIKTKVDEIMSLILENKIDHQEGFICIALLISRNSVDPNTKTGAIIIDDNFKMLSYGYNDVLLGYQEHVNWYNKDLGDWLNSKYPYVVHAERKAIYNGFKHKEDLTNTMMFASLFPCNECALAITESGINRLYYFDAKYYDLEFSIAARNIFDKCDIHYERIGIKEGYLQKIMKKLGDL